MRKVLDNLYIASGAIAALLIAAICLLVTTQVIFNLITKFGGSQIAMTIPSYAEFAGYYLAASSFLALAYTFIQGGHIRVTLLLGTLNGKPTRLVAEIFSLSICAGCSIFATYYFIHLVMESFQFGDKSAGIIAIPILIPQAPVAIGLVIFSIALVDVLVQTIQRRTPILSDAEEI